jgi:hypothetical protein
MHEYFFLHILYTFAIPEQKILYFATQNKRFYPNLLWISVTNVVIFAQIFAIFATLSFSSEKHECTNWLILFKTTVDRC